ncbi:N-acetylmuramoyl-L-alanine amidase [Thermodesulfobacteriota bacterium]
MKKQGCRTLLLAICLASCLTAVLALPGTVSAETIVTHHTLDMRPGLGMEGSLSGLVITERGLELSPGEGAPRTGFYESPPITADIVFNAIGVHWLETASGAGSVEVYCSVEDEEGRWTGWIPVPRDEDSEAASPFLPNGRANSFFGEVIGNLVLRYPAREGYGVRLRTRIEITSADGSAGPAVGRLTATIIDSTRYTPGRPEPGDYSQSYPKPIVVSRAEWGARAPAGSVSYCSPTTHLCVHHTANAGAYNAQTLEECKSNVRAVQAYHMDVNGWIDIGYNYTICKHGHIFEARYGGDNVRGAHDGYNCPSMGISAMGYFHPPYNNQPTTELLDTIMELFAWKVDQNGLDPHDVGYYSSWGGNINTIYGHKDVSATACPGDSLYPLLGSIRDGVADRIEGLPPQTEIIIDNRDAGYSSYGFWTSTTTPGYYGVDYEANDTGGTGDEWAAWRFTASLDGLYGVYVWYTEGGNRAEDAPYIIHHSLGDSLVEVNQRRNGSSWVELGTFPCTAGMEGMVVLTNEAAPGNVVIADAVLFVYLGPSCGTAPGTTAPPGGTQALWTFLAMGCLVLIPAAINFRRARRRASR